MLSNISWAYAFRGLLVGTLVGVTGVGGGSLMTPLLVLLFGINPATAVGTDLLFACITKTTGVAVHGFHGTVDWKIVRRLATGSVPATAATLLLLAHRRHVVHPPHDPIATILGIAPVLTAIALVFRRTILLRLAPCVEGLDDRRRLAVTIALGIFLGVFVSISSVGAGVIGVTVLLLLYPKLPTVWIVGSDIAYAVPLTLIAGVGHWFLGSVDTTILVSLLIGSIPASSSRAITRAAFRSACCGPCSPGPWRWWGCGWRCETTGREVRSKPKAGASSSRLEPYGSRLMQALTSSRSAKPFRC